MSHLGRKILLVTEDVHHARLIGKSLELSGRHQLVIADNLATAASEIQQSRPDMIMASPQFTDGNVADLLLTLERYSSIPILVIVRPDDVHLATKALDQGCQDYAILDTSTIGDMSHVVDRTLRLWRLEHEQPTRELALMDILKSKEALLKEMYHRVKNNFQTVCSVLSLQSQHLEDKAVLDMFTESQDRVRAMALIHERLYRSDDLTNVDFPEYISQLVQGLFWSYSIDRNRVDVRLDITQVKLDMITAIPCGLIINELVSNVLKHAFPADRKNKGCLEVGFKSVDADSYLLRVADNGDGIPYDVDIRNTDSLGLQLVIIFAEDQLNGVVSVDRDNGTAFEVLFQRRIGWRNSTAG